VQFDLPDPPTFKVPVDDGDSEEALDDAGMGLDVEALMLSDEHSCFILDWQTVQVRLLCGNFVAVFVFV